MLEIVLSVVKAVRDWLGTRRQTRDDAAALRMYDEFMDAWRHGRGNLMPASADPKVRRIQERAVAMGLLCRSPFGGYQAPEMTAHPKRFDPRW